MEMRLEPFLREPPMKVAFVPDRWTDVEGVQTPAPEGEYLAVCGIGDPGGFSQVLHEATGRPGELLPFPDHHDYSWNDAIEIQARLGGRTLVTTEKDAVKLHAFRNELPGLRILHLAVAFLEGEKRLWRHMEAVLEGWKGIPGDR
jgi:tetraacyldisaccharide-1-P 4'-kinase